MSSSRARGVRRGTRWEDPGDVPKRARSAVEGSSQLAHWVEDSVDEV